VKKVKVEDAVGMVLGHDLTKIVPGKFKGVAFKKGYIIREEDIQELKDMGKNHIYTMELHANEVHEDEAAQRIAEAVMGQGLTMDGPSEGKISLKAQESGLLKVQREALNEINDIELVILATLHNNSIVEKNQTVAGTRVIPLSVDKEKIEKVEELCKEMGKVVSIKPFLEKKVGIVVTGTEVYSGRITDKFGPVLEEKINRYSGKSLGVRYAPDDRERIEEEIQSFINQGAEIILTSGGMSVDADDVTPSAIIKLCSQVITYGAPVLPGAMFMLAYGNNVTILGIPACGMYHKTTVFDLVFPRLLTGEKLTRRDITDLGHGGLCLNCKVCHFPICPLGK